MTFKARMWQPIAVALSAINLVAVGVAAGAAEPWHAAVHAGVAMGFGLWAQRLWLNRRGNVGADRDDRLELLVGEVMTMRRELTETQERLDFAERLLTQRAEPHRVGPDH